MRRLVLAASLTLALFAARPALSATDAPAGSADGAAIDKAKAHFHRGVQLFNEGSLEAALAEFRMVYQITASYRVLFNTAQTYFELHDYVNAYKTLQQYSQEGGHEISPARRIQVDELSRKLEERIGYLVIVTNLDGADVRVDDLSVGMSPLKSPVLVNAGPRRVAVVKQGYDVAPRLVSVTGAERMKVILDVESASHPASDVPRRDLRATNRMASGNLVEKTSSPRRASRVGFIASVAVAGCSAVATGVLGYLALQAKRDFDGELDKAPNTQSAIDDARVRANRYAYATDAFAAATLLSTGMALYFAFTGDGQSTLGEGRPKHRLALAPALGGMVVHGRW